MDNEYDIYFKWQEYLEELAVRLNALHGMVDTINVGFQQERMEQQVINCMECIGFCVHDIKCGIDEKIVQLAEYNKHEKDVNVT